jgi:predicted transcriptional regulator of viral defense system
MVTAWLQRTEIGTLLTNEVSGMLAPTYRRRLLARAFEQFGYVTTADARDLGIPPVELRKLTARGGIRRVSQGVYRFEEIPLTDRDRYMEAVLCAGAGAHLSGESVLALHDLANVNPRKIRVATARRVRAAMPKTIDLVHSTATAADLTKYDGIPSAKVAFAIRECRGRVMSDRLLDALETGLRLGLVHRREAEALRVELHSRPE